VSAKKGSPNAVELLVRSKGQGPPVPRLVEKQGGQAIVGIARDDTYEVKLYTRISQMAYNLANFLRQLVLPKPIQGWTLTTLREKLIEIGAKVVAHAKYITFQLAEVAVPGMLFARILERIARLSPACASD